MSKFPPCVDVVTGSQPLELHEQYEDLAAQQVDLHTELTQKHQELRDDLDKRHVELLKLVHSLKNSFDGIHLSQQSKDNAYVSTTARDKLLQSGQGILGPNPYCVNSSRFHNLLFPRFNGKNPNTWLYRIDQYFAEDETPLNQRVRLVAMNLNDEALVWHRSYLKCRNFPTLPAWYEYISELIKIFGEEFADPMLELKQLRQIGTVREFQFAFDRLLAHCSLTIEQALSCFLRGLKEELRCKVEELKVFVTSVMTSFLLNINALFQSKCLSWNWKFPRVNLLTVAIVVVRLNHQVKRGHLLEVINLSSLYAIKRIQGAQTIHVTSYSDKRPIQILLDRGSTHNFIDSESAKSSGCNVVPTKVGYVSLGNNTIEATSGIIRNFQWMLEGTSYESDLIVFPVGKYDLVPGALWMRTLSPVTMDYSALTMTYNYLGKQHVLKGVSDDCRLPSPKVVNKSDREEVQFFMIHVMVDPPQSIKLISLHLSKDEAVPQPLHDLLNTYLTVFSEPTAFPPQIGVFDHKIPLQPGSKLVNIIPYRYSSMKKYIIEKLAKKILQQELIQYSNNPFSSHVVVVGKNDGTWRMCVDYRELNQCTIKDKFPIPIIDDLLNELSFLKLTLGLGSLSKVYGLISKPLTELLKKDNFHWSVSADQAFAELKMALTSVPVLALPNYSLPFVVKTDASGTGIGVVLIQSYHPITFISKGLAPRHVVLSMWLAKLLPFDFEVQNKKGKENIDVDSVSRVQGVELMSLPMSSVQADLWKEIQDSWTKILTLWHSSPVGRHSEIDVTIRKILSYFYWKGIRSDIVNFIHKCTVCQRNKYDIAVSPSLLQPLPILVLPWTDITMDYHLVLTTSDRDPIFISNFWKEFLTAQGVTLQTSTVYHPQTDGQPEVLNRCLETYLRCFSERWYNTSPRSAIQSSPFEPLYGYPPSLHDSDSTSIEEIALLREFKLQLAKFHLTQAQHRMQAHANSHRSDKQFKLKLCYEIPPTIIHPPVVNLASQYCPSPEAILDHRLIKRGNRVVAQCLITWTCLDPSYATWELASALKAPFPSFTLEDKGVVHTGVLIRLVVAKDETI
ncbi:uncharacterized protein [Nicotiana tomentosiformis]|uniref:uncharacterized protein n=1 Tax=Nicotiana tomentosiformis TaxID=4098 RepID=UPI00388C5463